MPPGRSLQTSWFWVILASCPQVPHVLSVSARCFSDGFLLFLWVAGESSTCGNGLSSSSVASLEDLIYADCCLIWYHSSLWLMVSDKRIYRSLLREVLMNNLVHCCNRVFLLFSSIDQDIFFFISVLKILTLTAEIGFCYARISFRFQERPSCQAERQRCPPPSPPLPPPLPPAVLHINNAAVVRKIVHFFQRLTVQCYWRHANCCGVLESLALSLVHIQTKASWIIYSRAGLLLHVLLTQSDHLPWSRVDTGCVK